VTPPSPEIEELVRREASGERLKYLLFWGHRPERGGGVGRSCLSQWWPSAFTIDGVEYRTAEHYMMSEKARLFGDSSTAARILEARTPGEAKSLGRRIEAFDEDTWLAHRYEIVVRGSAAKFGSDPELTAYLCGTAGRVLVEASPVDRVWGIGLAAEDDAAQRPAQWRGLNLLGFALMRAREQLMQAREQLSET